MSCVWKNYGFITVARELEELICDFNGIAIQIYGINLTRNFNESLSLMIKTYYIQVLLHRVNNAQKRITLNH